MCVVELFDEWNLYFVVGFEFDEFVWIDDVVKEVGDYGCLWCGDGVVSLECGMVCVNGVCVGDGFCCVILWCVWLFVWIMIGVLMCLLRCVCCIGMYCFYYVFCYLCYFGIFMIFFFVMVVGVFLDFVYFYYGVWLCWYFGMWLLNVFLLYCFWCVLIGWLFGVLIW